jgi:hypothetical protein
MCHGRRTHCGSVPSDAGTDVFSVCDCFPCASVSDRYTFAFPMSSSSSHAMSIPPPLVHNFELQWNGKTILCTWCGILLHEARGALFMSPLATGCHLRESHTKQKSLQSKTHASPAVLQTQQKTLEYKAHAAAAASTSSTSKVTYNGAHDQMYNAE